MSRGSATEPKTLPPNQLARPMSCRERQASSCQASSDLDMSPPWSSGAPDYPLTRMSNGRRDVAELADSRGAHRWTGGVFSLRARG